MSKNADEEERSRDVPDAVADADADPPVDDCTCSLTGGNMMVVTDLFADCSTD